MSRSVIIIALYGCRNMAYATTIIKEKFRAFQEHDINLIMSRFLVLFYALNKTLSVNVSSEMVSTPH